MCLESLFLKVLSEEDSLIPGERERERERERVFQYSPVLTKK